MCKFDKSQLSMLSYHLCEYDVGNLFTIFYLYAYDEVNNFYKKYSMSNVGVDLDLVNLTTLPPNAPYFYVLCGRL